MKDRTDPMIEKAYRLIVRLYWRVHYAKEAKRAERRLQATDELYAGWTAEWRRKPTVRWYSPPIIDGRIIAPFDWEHHGL